MKLIVNTDRKLAIGNGGRLLFSLRRDMEFFKSRTTGNIIVMGRKTFQSLPGGKPLPERTNIVLSRSPGFAPDGVTVCAGIPELLRVTKNAERDVYVIGGASVYRELLPYCDTAYVTKVDTAAECADAFMVDLDRLPEWELAAKSDEFKENGVKFRFLTYKRK